MLRYQELNSSCPYAMPDELEFIRQEALKLSQDQHFVMIGCGPGVMAVAALESHPHPPLTTIIDLGTSYYCDAHLRGAGVNMERVTFILGNSITVGERWDKPVDLLIVDGDHEYRGVAGDIKMWQGLVRSGGYIFFHDYLTRDGGFNGVGEWQKGDVAWAIQDYLTDDFRMVSQVGISVVYRRD